jgi:hypothetical protein
VFTLQSTDVFPGLENDEALNSAQIDQRARALWDQLTLDEKISLMHGQQPFWLGLAAKSPPGGYSSRVWIAGEVTRLGIPGIVGRHALDPKALWTDFRVV